MKGGNAGYVANIPQYDLLLKHYFWIKSAEGKQINEEMCPLAPRIWGKWTQL